MCRVDYEALKKSLEDERKYIESLPQKERKKYCREKLYAAGITTKKGKLRAQYRPPKMEYDFQI